MSKLSRGHKGEEEAISLLCTINRYHHLINDVTFVNAKSEMTHQIDHILIHPYGVFVIETKNYFGTIEVDSEGFWYKTIKHVRSKINNPLLQNKSHAINLYRLLNREYDVIPVVVFVKNNAPYLPNDNVINLCALLEFIESYPYKRLYQEKTLDKIKEIITSKVSIVDNKEHLENIKYYKQITFS